MENYKHFISQDELKRILRDINYDMDDITVCLNKIGCYITSDSSTNSIAPHNGEAVINATPINMVNENSSADQLVIILA